MRIELDKAYDLLYIEVRPDLEVERTEDLADGVHADLDAEDRVVGFEFLSLEAYDAFVRDQDLPPSPVDWLRNEAGLRLFGTVEGG